MYVREPFESKEASMRGASESRTMVQRSTLLMIGLGFSLGLSLGLLLQLPGGASSPGQHSRERRDVADRSATRPGPPAAAAAAATSQQAEHGTGAPEDSYSSSDPSASSQTGHVPQIPSANTHPEHSRAAKPRAKQTSGQNLPTGSVSVLQVRIRKTKDTIENIKEQHGWNSSKSHGKHRDKKPASVASHRDAAEKTTRSRSQRSKTKTVSKAGDGSRQGSGGLSSITKFSRDVSTRNISLNPDKLDLHEDLSQRPRDSISQPNGLEKRLTFAGNLNADSRNKFDNVLSFRHHDDSTERKMRQSPVGISGSDLFNGIYWSEGAEMLVPDSITAEETRAWRRKVGAQAVASLRPGCGRQQNRLLRLADGTAACARYRINRDQIQGEVFSYYLARLLGIQNVPPAILELPDPSDPRWGSVLDELVSAQWNPERVVVLTPWIQNLDRVFIPHELRPASRKLHPDPTVSEGRTPSDIAELVQWSDLIVLDYLTANVDRAVNNLYNLQWNSDMMSAPTHNLEKVGEQGPLVFLDNESGLFHSYRLLDKYSDYHESFLNGLCIFRRSTAAAVTRLAKEGSIASELAAIFFAEEPLHTHLPLPQATNMAILQRRLQNVANQIANCDQIYRN